MAWLAAALVATSPAPARGAPSYSLFHPTPANRLRDMDTDRPNATNTPHTVDAGHVQIELGVVDFTHDRAGDPGARVRSDDVALGQASVRVGVRERWELSASVSAIALDRARDETSGVVQIGRGFGDVVVGGKWNLWGDAGGDQVGASGLALQPQLKLPTANRDVGNGRPEGSIVVPFLVNLPRGWHLGLQSGLARVRDGANTRDVTGFPSSVSLDRLVLGGLDAYLEVAADPTTEARAETPWTLNVGGTLPLGRRTVLDAGLNWGLVPEANDVEALLGVSRRY